MKNERNFCPARGAKVRLPLLPCGRETDGFEREGERLAELNGGAGRRPSLSLSVWRGSRVPGHVGGAAVSPFVSV